MTGDQDKDEPQVFVRSTARPASAVERPFPSAMDGIARLRVAFEGSAFERVGSHVTRNTSEEVCGVLAGAVCTDGDGRFVHVERAVEASTARSGHSHVTLTDETWTAIHRVMERDHPELQIVGWYHSHPGFGVELSDMDVFIHRNFFPSSEQIALVVDPLSGEEALCVNGRDGPRYLDRFWVDGRERRCRVPAWYSRGGATDVVAAMAEVVRLQTSIDSRLGEIAAILEGGRRARRALAWTLGGGAALALAAALASGPFWGSMDRPVPGTGYVEVIEGGRVVVRVPVEPEAALRSGRARSSTAPAEDEPQAQDEGWSAAWLDWFDRRADEPPPPQERRRKQ